MIDMDKTLDQVSDALIKHLRAELNDPDVGYETALTQIEGGYETFTFGFKLSGVREELSNPLVLRLFPSFHVADKAVLESAVQNVLAEAGYPVPRVYFTCTDKSILGGAFFVMEFLQGENMLAASSETFPDMLGKIHAALHGIDPGPLVKALKDRGIEENRYRLDGKLDRLNDRIESAHPWLREGIDWLLETRPPEPETLSICHGDFHPLNILIKDGKVTGVLDWPGFIIADPVLDVAFTVVLSTVIAKQFMPQIEWEKIREEYINSYRKARPLDLKHLEYYRALRCVMALLDGAEGQEVWKHPLAVKELTDQIHEITKIRITPSNQAQ